MKEEKGSLLSRQFATFLTARSQLPAAAARRFCDLVLQLGIAMDGGHSCLPVTAAEEALLRSCRLVAEEAGTPLVLRGGRLYLQRYAAYESRLAEQILDLAAHRAPLDPPVEAVGMIPPLVDQRQQEAVELALARCLCLICGGPGTGKTTTVARILAFFAFSLAAGARIALAAPTGKAAGRLGEAIAGGLAALSLPPNLHALLPQSAQTLHRLLGVRPSSPYFRHHRQNPMPWDVVVVDEASMVDLAMMSKLVDALKPGARLILLGDKDQLASVESGAVLADLLTALPENRVELATAYRFDTTIRQLAEAINRADGEEVWRQLQDPRRVNVCLAGSMATILQGYEEFLRLAATASAADLGRLFTIFARYQILCASHHGRRGVETVNREIVRFLAGLGLSCRQEGWYPGRPVLVTRNAYHLELYNGDIGIFLPEAGVESGKVWFAAADGGFRGFFPALLPPCTTAYAITIHKSQGSEWDKVVVVLPGEDSPLLSRELLYTAVTRARVAVQLVAEKPLLCLALSRSTRRCSGLAGLLLAGRPAAATSVDADDSPARMRSEEKGQ